MRVRSKSDDHQLYWWDFWNNKFWDKGNTFHKPRHKNYTDSCNNESEIFVAYLEQRIVHFEKGVKIMVDSDSVIPQEKQNMSDFFSGNDLRQKRGKWEYWIKHEQNNWTNSKQTNASETFEQNMTKQKENSKKSYCMYSLFQMLHKKSTNTITVLSI